MVGRADSGAGSDEHGSDGLTRADAGPTVLVDQPFRIGRYTVLRTLGHGGMGVVYAAYDDELDRRVALKVLATAPTVGSLGKARMVREAQALARLSHPNVVQVYEVGDVDGRLYLAMEYVEGHGLKEWVQAAPRTWRQIVDVCVQAGRGLEAAHAAGLVHRDFKPANTIVGDDGRVRVIDFGLARADLDNVLAASDPAASLAGRALLISTSTLGDELTQAGTLLGTPAYMAPEQLFRRPADARSDLFSFCVTVWEALYRERPFTARTVEELRARVPLGPPPSPNKRVPAAVHRVLVRGLANDPADRPPGMATLLADLQRAAEDRRRFYMSLGSGAAIATALAAGWLIAQAPPAEAAARCDEQGALVGVWDPEARAAVETAMRATGLAYAGTTWSAIAPRLDSYAAELTTAIHGACLARLGSGDALPPVLAEQALCIERRRVGLAASVGVLRRADAGVVAGAVATVAGLEPLAPCNDLEALGRAHQPHRDPATAIATATVWQQLAEARAEHHAEHHARGRGIADAALASAETLGDPRLLAAALHRAALLHEGDGDAAAARSLAHRAYSVAEAAGDDALVVDVATSLVRLEGTDLRDLTAAKVWHEVATAKLERGAADDAQRVRLLLEAGIARVEAGALLEGVPLIEQAVARTEVLRDREPRLHISALNLLASGVLRRTGDLPRAVAVTERSIQLAEQHYGAGHPYLGMLIHNLGVLQYQREDFATALGQFESALKLREAAYGPDHPEVAQTLNGLAAALGDVGRRDEAIVVGKRALAIEEARRGSDHPELCYPLNNLATLLLQAGRVDEAAVYLQRARNILDARGLGDNSLSALVDESLANVALARGHQEQARDLYGRALATAESSLGADNVAVGVLHRKLAAQLIALGQPALAAGHVAAAVKILERIPGAEQELAAVHALAAGLP